MTKGRLKVKNSKAKRSPAGSDDPPRRNRNVTIYDRIRWAQSLGLGPAEERTLIALVRWADRKTGYCDPKHLRRSKSGWKGSYAQLAEHLDRSRVTVRKHVRALVAKGFVLRHRQENEGGLQTANAYSLLWDEDHDENRAALAEAGQAAIADNLDPDVQHRAKLARKRKDSRDIEGDNS